jgi:hypothetical protein
MKRLSIIAIVILLSACGTHYRVVSGEGYPTFADTPRIGGIVGVLVSQESAQSKAAAASIEAIANKFSSRLRDEGAFDVVIYPYTEHAAIKPDFLITLKINSFDDKNMAENTGKAVAIGASFFLLSPVIPIRFEMKLDMEATVTDAAKSMIGKYSYGDIYELKYTTFTPNMDMMAEWVEESVRHLAEKVIEKILQDKRTFDTHAPASASSVTSPH